MDTVTKTLLFIGITCILFALIWHVSGGKIPLGRLPGDIRIESENTKIYIPLTTGILLSIIFSVLSYIFRKFFN